MTSTNKSITFSFVPHPPAFLASNIVVFSQPV